MKKKKVKLKKKPVIILLITIIIIIFVIVKSCDKPKRKEPKSPVIDLPQEEKISPLEMNIQDFTLEGYFIGTVLEENKATEEYMSNIIYAGDSIALYYTINKINKKSVWHQISINPLTAQTCSVYVNSNVNNIYESYVELFEEKKPDVVVMTLGTNGVSTMDQDYFIEQYKIFLQSIINVSPDTRLIIQSIPPVPIERDIEGKTLNNDKINKYNYYIAKMCEELGLEFLFSANSMKDSTGGCKEGYCTKDLHPTKEGNEELYKYAMNHLGIK